MEYVPETVSIPDVDIIEVTHPQSPLGLHQFTIRNIERVAFASRNCNEREFKRIRQTVGTYFV